MSETRASRPTSRLPKDKCPHVAAMVVTYYDRIPIYWCPRCERHLKESDLVAAVRRAS